MTKLERLMMDAEWMGSGVVFLVHSHDALRAAQWARLAARAGYRALDLMGEQRDEDRTAI